MMPNETTELQSALDRCPLVDAEIARLLHVPVPTIDRWRSGMSRPHAKALPVILAVLRELPDAE